MMEALSAGFCVAALAQTLALGEIEGWHQQWPQPTLQVVDIQRYPRCPTMESEPCRFYIAASDGVSLVWLVVPPQTPLEEAIAGFELEVGCSMTLLSHTLVTAANGLNVVVPLQVKYSSNTLRLLGQPTYHDDHFQLSCNSLVQRGTDEEGRGIAGTSTAAVGRLSHRIAVRDFVDNPEKALGNWSIAVRVVWRSRAYRMNSWSRTLGTNAVSVSEPRFVFRCLLVDERGDGIVAAFFGGEALLDRIQLHDCLLLAQGTVKWGVGEVAAPVELQFGEKSIVELLEAGSARQSFPFYAAALVGEVAESLRSVAEVLSSARVGDFTSVVGLVVAVQGSTQVTTKRGRVWRSVVTLADEVGRNASDYNDGIRNSSGCVEVTLWGEIAESVEPAKGEYWAFHFCAVQLFQHRKTLSSRTSTMAVQLRPLQLPTNVTDAASLPRGCAAATAGPAQSSPRAVINNEPCAKNTNHAPLIARPKSVHFVLNIHEVSPTLPVLARVQKVCFPLLTWTCVVCHSVMDTIPHAPYFDVIYDHCAVCGGTELSPSYHLRVELSDSLSTAAVSLHGSAAEALLETTALYLARALQRRPTAGLELRDRLVCVPVLLWLLADAVDENGMQQYIAAACRRLHYTTGCSMLLSAIEAFTDEVDERSAEVPMNR